MPHSGAWNWARRDQWFIMPPGSPAVCRTVREGGGGRVEIARATIDDLMREVFQTLEAKGTRITPTKGPARELIGTVLRLADPRARLSRSEGRGKVFSALGEALWYFSGSDELEFIRYYIKQYRRYSDDGRTLYGAYGPRLFGPESCDPVAAITSLLTRKREAPKR